jgi:hypothetical protein
MEHVAHRIKEYLKANALDISVVSEYSKAFKLFVNQRKVSGNGK